MGDYDNLKEDIGEIKVATATILRILNGNGTDGLVTKVSLNRASVRWIWRIMVGAPSVVGIIIAGFRYLAP